MNNTPTAKLPTKTLNLDAYQALPVHWVTNDDELYALIDIIDSIDKVALDTEFVRKTTLHPILALVQVNTGEAIYLLDAPRLDLTEFWQALAEIPQMIWYACGEDLTIFYAMSGCPPLTNIVDVQIGVGYLADRTQMGFAFALEQVFGITLNKSEQQSDWLKRPISYEQECYAVDDVRYLLALHETVERALTDNGFADFAKEDCDLYAKEIYDNLTTLDDELLYVDYVQSSYNRQQLACLQNLLVWRAKFARAKNKPLGFFFNKQSLREIVEQMPTSIKALSYTTINRVALREYGKEMIVIVQNASRQKDSECPKMPVAYYTLSKSLKKKIKACIEREAGRLGVPSGVFFRSRWLDSVYLAVMQDDVEALADGLMGYRKAWTVGVLMPLIAEHRADLFLVGENVDATVLSKYQSQADDE